MQATDQSQNTLLTGYRCHKCGCKTAKSSIQLTATTIILHCEWKKTLFRWGGNILHDFAAQEIRTKFFQNECEFCTRYSRNNWCVFFPFTVYARYTNSRNEPKVDRNIKIFITRLRQRNLQNWTCRCRV